ncbi:uncharacterized protein LOC119355741 [Triticum dicoccoides]|uniref:uncharacterized protein LOC119355741 n=1 Tax=Triticum dicoccoides TaxID=85692 RepID=UPI00188E73CC|nr:uncharacterized protein LOC119355741 [Triticum dicoccoides]
MAPSFSWPSSGILPAGLIASDLFAHWLGISAGDAPQDGGEASSVHGQDEVDGGQAGDAEVVVAVEVGREVAVPLALEVEVVGEVDLACMSVWLITNNNAYWSPAMDWLGYILTVHSNCHQEYTIGGYNLLVQLFCLEWVDFKGANINTDLVPKIASYSSEKMDELITLFEEDRERPPETRRYKAKPEGSMLGLAMRWHPLMVPRIEVVPWGGSVEVTEGMQIIMFVLEDHVKPMLVDAVVTVAAETSEENRSSVVEELMRQADEKMRRLQFCFGRKLYPGAVSTAPMIRPISCM